MEHRGNYRLSNVVNSCRDKPDKPAGLAFNTALSCTHACAHASTHKQSGVSGSHSDSNQIEVNSCCSESHTVLSTVTTVWISLRYN